jgi:multidrug efflux pump
MNICEPFIRRPIATTLLVIAISLAGAVAFRLLPVSPLPQVDFPTISVSAALPGASPETMASSVATPLERQFGRIASVTEMTSSSSLGSTNVILQFDLNRDINAAARDVQAAINAARGYLPSNLPSNPTYRKVNPADSPIFIIALTSNVLGKARMYDAASSILAQKLSQVSGVGQVIVGGSALPGVRIELNPTALNKYGIGLEQVRGVLSNANSNTPKGHFSDGHRIWEVGANDQLFHAVDYTPLIVAYRKGTPVRVSDIGEGVDAPEEIRAAGYSNAQPSVLLVIFRQPGANIIDTVDGIYAALPQLKAAIPQSIEMRVALDQTQTIRASVRDVERTLVISVLLVILVVFLFLRNPRTTFIPSVAVPVSLVGTFGVMYLLGYSLDNLSLMALCISTGFVVDDAIVVIENISRYLEMGMAPFQAALQGAKEIGFTVVTISISLVAVFIPLLLMGGIVGRLFREFAVTLAAAITVSMVVSLTATPMMCAHLLKEHEAHGWLYRASERAFNWVVRQYGNTLRGVLFREFSLLSLSSSVAVSIWRKYGKGLDILRILAGIGLLFLTIPHFIFRLGDAIGPIGLRLGVILLILTAAFGLDIRQAANRLKVTLSAAFVTFLTLVAAIALNFYLYVHVPKGFFPQQDNGRLMGAIQADQDTSFQAMNKTLREMSKIVVADPAVDTVEGFMGGGGPGGSGQLNSARMFIALKPPAVRKINADLVIQRLRPKLGRVPGATLYLQAAQDIRVGGRFGASQYQFTMRGDNLKDLQSFGPRMLRELRTLPQITDVNTDQQDQGLQAYVQYDRATAARFGISPQLIDNTLYDAFGERQVSTMYTPLNQYHVVMEVAPEFWQNPLFLRQVYVESPGGTEVPLSAITKASSVTAPLAVNHQGLTPSVTISFNLRPGIALGDAADAIISSAAKIGLPATIRTGFAGNAQAYQDSLGGELLLILAALISVYLVLGILYESYVHPVTILSTLPSAGVGALLALLVTHTELTVIAIIGIILLIGIVKKNAILMIDFALAAERGEGKSSQESIYEACLLRFRPILMTTMAAMLGAVPLALGTGMGSEFRRPLGIAIIGGLAVSQLLTLYTTPVVYLYFDRFQNWLYRIRGTVPAADLPLAPEV